MQHSAVVCHHATQRATQRGGSQTLLFDINLSILGFGNISTDYTIESCGAILLGCEARSVPQF
jgi:hypothetical protein